MNPTPPDLALGGPDRRAERIVGGRPVDRALARLAEDAKKARARKRSRWPLQAMSSTQAKLCGGAIATILVWVWGQDGRTEIPGEVGTALGVLLVALVDMTLGGKPE